jgi:hypothetical protein
MGEARRFLLRCSILLAELSALPPTAIRLPHIDLPSALDAVEAKAQPHHRND